ncbi:MAG: DnaJ central domain [Chthoniobacter sp.]|jgi:DnaJ-class molecular chaperone|nr:DnaJ central domain [Chthoniobacter sp.]
MKALLITMLILGMAFVIFVQQRKMAELTAALAEPSATPVETTTNVETSKRAPAANAAWQRIACPACHGEGAIMIRRRTISGTLQDSHETCPLCNGSGYHTIPAGKPSCPDCLGMGKRLVHPSIPTGIGGYGAALAVLGEQGYPQKGPDPTGCVRCLGKGYLVLPAR